MSLVATPTQTGPIKAWTTIKTKTSPASPPRQETTPKTTVTPTTSPSYATHKEEKRVIGMAGSSSNSRSSSSQSSSNNVLSPNRSGGRSCSSDKTSVSPSAASITSASHSSTSSMRLSFSKKSQPPSTRQQPKPILKRKTRYTRPPPPPPPEPIWFKVEEKRKAGKGSKSEVAILHLVCCVPLAQPLYELVADKLGTSVELIHIYFESITNSNGGMKTEAIEIVMDEDVARCVAESSSTNASSSTSAPKVTVVVTDIGLMGRLCLTIGSRSLSWCRANEALWLSLRTKVGRAITHIQQQLQPLLLPQSPPVGGRQRLVLFHDNGSINAQQKPSSSTPATSKPQKASTVSIPVAMATSLATAGISMLSLYALNLLLDRVRLDSPRMAYRPTRHLLATLNHTSKSVTTTT